MGTHSSRVEKYTDDGFGDFSFRTVNVLSLHVIDGQKSWQKIQEPDVPREEFARSSMSRIALGTTFRKGPDRERMEESSGVEVSLCSSTTRTLAICIRGRHQDGWEEKQSTTYGEKIDETS